MLQITETEIRNRLRLDNPWWETADFGGPSRDWPKRDYFDAFVSLATQRRPRRAVVLMGPRRVGKTVMLTQAIRRLIDQGVEPRCILYVSVDTPTYTGLALERLLHFFLAMHEHGKSRDLFVFFDEIQYHPDWERHLKSLVDSYPQCRFVASGSAAAALKMKSRESGAGRFTDFLLPPLTFAEFLDFRGLRSSLVAYDPTLIKREDIAALNDAFVEYLNFGGFPEAVLQDEVRQQMDRFIASDIVDKVLLRDLPSLYGISDTQELKRLFSTLAYNTGQEVSYEGLSKASGVAKNTIRRYLDFLEAAFLVHRLNRIDVDGRRFKRVTHFKVYLTNICIRAALFGPVAPDDPLIGSIVESAYVGQFTQSLLSEDLHYARWKDGEVDLVRTDGMQRKVSAAEEIKWSDRIFDRTEELQSLVRFCRENGLSEGSVLTRTSVGTKEVDTIRLDFTPVAIATLVAANQVVHRPLGHGLHPKTAEKFGKSP